MFLHDVTYNATRQTLGLQSPDNAGNYYPACATITIQGEDVQNRSPFTILHHELTHCHQMFSTSAGLLTIALLSLRNSYVHDTIAHVNKTFYSGLWVPVLGWLRDIDPGDLNGWWDRSQPYYYISMMKKSVGTVDSVLFTLGVIETNNLEDRRYWFERFPWGSLYPDKTWQQAFEKMHVSQGVFPVGVYSLIEASTLYLELLYRYKTIARTNDAIYTFTQALRDAFGENEIWQYPEIVTYYGPFLECERRWADSLHYPWQKEAIPYHLVPILAFWALNTPLPQVSIDEDILGRTNPGNYQWVDVAPYQVFYALLQEQISDPKLLTASVSGEEDLIKLAKLILPAVEERFGKGFVDQLIRDDLDYIEKASTSDKPYLRAGLLALDPPQNLEQRLAGFFSYPPQTGRKQNLDILATGNYPDQIGTNQKAILINQIAEHLFPIWSLGTLPRFRLGKPLNCPSQKSPFNQMCPVPKQCSGEFPGTSGLPSSCWFQEILTSELHLDVNRIGIVGGEYGSEQEVIGHQMWDAVPSDANKLDQEKIRQAIRDAAQILDQSASYKIPHYVLTRCLLTMGVFGITPEQFNQEVVNLRDAGIIDGAFCRYLEESYSQNNETPIESRAFYWLAKAIRNIVDVIPTMPKDVLADFQQRIDKALNPPQALAVEQLLDELADENRLTREFAEMFLAELNKLAERGDRLAASAYWDMTREKLDPEILAEIDYWLG